MGLGKKPAALTPRRLHFGLDTLSKTALIDLVTDLARKELGEDTDEDTLACLIEGWHGPVARARNDAEPRIQAAMRKLDKSDAAYVARNRA
jgi:hypothetical protein